MATVATLMNLFDALFGQGRSSFEPDSKIALLDAAKTEVWRVLVATNPQENWFLEESQNTDSSADNFFGNLNTAAREYALPKNYHQMRAIEPQTTGHKHLRFHRVNLDELEFRRQRATGGKFGGDVRYDIVGVSPGKIMFAEFPIAALHLKLWYTRTPTAWTANTDATTDFPETTYPMIAEWAVKRASLNLGDPRFGQFHMEWENRLQRYLNQYRRDNSGVDVVTGYLEDSQY